MNRRDLLHIIGRRAERLTPDQSARAWRYLAGQLLVLGDVAAGRSPRYNDLIEAVRRSTIAGRKEPPLPPGHIRYDLRLVREANGDLRWED